MINVNRSFLLVALILLIAVVAISVRTVSGGKKLKSSADLISELPRVTIGWALIDQPIATTPEMQKSVNEMLNYDEAVFRTYSKSGVSFSVYAAYWSPGKFHPRLISIHTPDVCWLSNGMTMPVADSNRELVINGRKFLHGQYREFVAPLGNRSYVIYWHILNGKLSGYAEGDNSKSQDFFASMWRDIREGIGEQYFIRISSPIPLGDLLRDPFFVEVLRHFEPVLLSRD